MREQNGGILAAFVIALVALTAVGAWSLSQDDRPPIDVSIRRGAADPTARYLSDQLACPDGGRGTGVPGVAWPQVDEPEPTTNTLRGQAIPFEILLSVPDDGPDRDRAAFDVVLTPFRDRGTAAFDADEDLTCVFVDTADPLTADGGTPAAVEVESDEIGAGARVTVDGLDPGDTVVVEAWAVVTPSGTARSGSATASLRSRSTPGGRRTDVDESVVRVPIEFGTDGGREAVTVTIDDGDAGGGRGERLAYEITIRNPHTEDVVNDLRLVAVPSDLAPVESFTLGGEGADATACRLEVAPRRLRCATSHLGPGQAVHISFAPRIADVATPQWLRETGGCTAEDSDICLTVEVAWAGSERTADSLVTSEPATVLGVHPSIGLAKYRLSDPSDIGGAPAIEYSVISATAAPLAEVLLRDEGCEDVELVDGDGNGDDLLDADEEWRYRCRGPAEHVLATRAVVRAVQAGVSVGDVAVVGP